MIWRGICRFWHRMTGHIWSQIENWQNKSARSPWKHTHKGSDLKVDVLSPLDRTKQVTTLGCRTVCHQSTSCLRLPTSNVTDVLPKGRVNLSLSPKYCSGRPDPYWTGRQGRSYSRGRWVSRCGLGSFEDGVSEPRTTRKTGSMDVSRKGRKSVDWFIGESLRVSVLTPLDEETLQRI